MEVNIAEFKTVAKGFSILYIEEHEELRNLTKEILARFFETIYTASDGQTGYEIFLEKKPDIIITDIVLPNLNGIELIKKVKGKGYNPLIFVLTAYTELNYLMELIALKVDYFSVKPVNNKALLTELYNQIKLLEKPVENKKAFSIDLADITRNMPQGIVIYERGVPLWANQRFLEMTGFDAFETFTLEAPCISSLFVAGSEGCLYAPDNHMFLAHLKSSELPLTVHIAGKKDIYTEYFLGYSVTEQNGYEVVTFTEVSALLNEYKYSTITGLPNKFALREQIKLLFSEESTLDIVTCSIRHFDTFVNYYGKRTGNDLERFFVKRIISVLKEKGIYEQVFMAYYDQNRYVIVSKQNLEHLKAPLAQLKLNEFVFGDEVHQLKEKKEIGIEALFKYSHIEVEKDPELIDVHIQNDFDELNYMEA